MGCLVCLRTVLWHCGHVEVRVETLAPSYHEAAIFCRTASGVFLRLEEVLKSKGVESRS